MTRHEKDKSRKRLAKAVPNDPDAIIRRILGKDLTRPLTELDRPVFARAVLVVDEGVACLAAALKEANFLVISVDSRIREDGFRRSLLSDRILVTASTPAFLEDAPIVEYGIIGLDALPAVDAVGTYKKNTTARMISTAFTKHCLVAKQYGFVLMLKPDGEHVFCRLE
jgi:hypothetical protein